MNDELKTKLMHYLETIEKGVNQGADFVAEQAPLYVQEFLAWEFWGNILGGFALVALSLCAFLFYKKCMKIREDAGMWSDWGVGAFICMVISIALLGGSCIVFSQAVKTQIAPRVVIVESLQKAIK